VAHFDLPYRMNTLATRIEKENDFFNIFTENKKFQTRRVIVASGAFQKPYILPIIKNENAVVSHVHSSLYTEPKDLNNGTALIVGGANLRVQILVDQSKAREVIFAISHKFKLLLLELFRKSMFYWLEKLQLLYASTDTIRRRLFQKRNDPIFGRELKQANKSRNVKIKPRVTVVDGKKVTFSDGSSLDVNQIIWATG